MERKAAERRSVPVVNPLGFSTATRTNLAKRLPTLKGKTIGLLDNAKPRADIVLAQVKQYLESKGAICSIYEFKPHLAKPLPKEQVERLAKTGHTKQDIRLAPSSCRRLPDWRSFS
jgi:hypothetical protein